LDADLVPVLTSAADLEGFGRAARARGMRAAAHVKIDTGMSRLGVRADDIDSFLAAAARNPEVVVAGLCTHLASATADAARATNLQPDAFGPAPSRFRAAGHKPLVFHAANTAATYRHPRAHFTHVRSGIALFGGDEPSGARLRPALRLVTRVV